MYLEDLAETNFYKQMSDDMEQLWRTAIGGKQEPAVIAYTVETSGKISTFRFLWSAQNLTVREKVITRMLALGPYTGVKREINAVEAYLGIAEANKEFWKERGKAEEEVAGLVAENKYGEAEAHARALLLKAEKLFGRNYPETIESKIFLARLYLNIGKTRHYEREFKEAISRYQVCFDQSPDDYGYKLRCCHLEMAEYFEGRGNTKAAEQHYLRCLKANESKQCWATKPLDPILVGAFYERLDRSKTAEKMYQLSVKNITGEGKQPSSNFCDNWAALANFYIRQGKSERAIECYEELVQIYSQLEAPINYKEDFDWFTQYKSLLTNLQLNDKLEALHAKLEPIEYKAGRKSTGETGFGYVDRDGQYIISPQFRTATDFSEGLAAVRLDAQGADLDRWVFIDKCGNHMFDRIFSHAHKFNAGFASVQLSGENRYRVIDREGNLLPELVTAAWAECDGMTLVQLKANDDAQFSYMDRDREVWSARFSDGRNFQNGRAIVGMGGHHSSRGCCVDRLEGISYGVIDQLGNWLIQPNYERLFELGDHLFVFKSWHDEGGVMDIDGNVVLTLPGLVLDSRLAFTEGLAQVKWNRKHGVDYGMAGFIDASGKIAIKPDFNFAYPFKDGVSLVRTDTNYGFIDRKGNFIIPAEYVNANEFSEDRAAVKLTEKQNLWGYINLTGELVIEPRFQSTREFSEGRAVVTMPDSEGGKDFYIDKQGASMFDTQFDAALPFKNGRAIVRFKDGINSKSGVIDEQGNYVLQPEYALLHDYCEGLAAVCLKYVSATMSTSSSSGSSFRFV